jgi:GNAT superfamily N-acetyltransferase
VKVLSTASGIAAAVYGRPLRMVPGSMSITYRPMREADLRPAFDLQLRSFIDLDRRRGAHEVGPLPDPDIALLRFRRLLEADPGGAWVAERDGALAGVALALLRDGFWGLSLLVVDPPAQGGGAGRELLARAWEYGDGARGHVILSSSDPRAIRAYARLGMELHPAIAAKGRPQGIAEPGGVRTGGRDDLPLTESVDRAVRGAAHGGDVLAMLASGHELLVAPERGYALLRGGELRLLAAFEDEAARELLRAALARIAQRGEDANLLFITARQQWAVEVCVEARLELEADCGCVFARGDVGPLAPYLPSGAYL